PERSRPRRRPSRRRRRHGVARAVGALRVGARGAASKTCTRRRFLLEARDAKRFDSARQRTASKPRGHSSTAPLLSCRERLSRRPRCAPSTRTWPSHILVGLSFNVLVHGGAGDPALTSPAADRRKTKPSDREARARPGDRDPPTPKGTAERSVRA